ncbi:MAG: CHAP domain-containing protein [Clostridia bacterium]|nr:CHAP domain-containing protein [Clostridia bacterium]
MKRFTGFFLALVLVMSLLMTAGSTVASASTNGHTQAEAVAYANSLVYNGQALDYDGNGAWCIDVIYYYYRFLGQSIPAGNANTYDTNALPPGWTRVYSNPQPGDIYQTDAGPYGHVAVVTELRANTIVVVQQSQYTKPFASEVSYSSAKCYIRPDFVTPQATLDVNVYLDGVANNCGVNGSNGTVTFDLYINNSRVVDDAIDYCTTLPSGTRYLISDIKASGALIYTGNASYSGTVGNSNIEVRIPVRTGLTVTSESSGKFRITIPAGCQFDIYGSATAVSRKCYALANDHEYSFTCDKKYILSDGSTRYRYLDGSEYNYFTFTSQMKAADGSDNSLSVRTTENGNFTVTIPANYKLKLYTTLTLSETTHYYDPSDEYTLDCTEKYVMSDGSVRYKFTASNVNYYFTYASGMKVTTTGTGSASGASFNLKAEREPGTYENAVYVSWNKRGRNIVRLYRRDLSKNTIKCVMTTNPDDQIADDCIYDWPEHDGKYVYYLVDTTSGDRSDEVTIDFRIIPDKAATPEQRQNISGTEATSRIDSSSQQETTTETLKPATGITESTTAQIGHEPEETDECNCYCHCNDGRGKLWRVLMAICRVLGITDFRYCECGSRHY